MKPITALVVLAWITTVAGAAEQESVQYNLSAGEATKTLHEFARQSGLQLLFDPEPIAGLRTPSIAGRYVPEVALGMLLRGRPYTLRQINERTIAIIWSVPAVPDDSPVTEDVRIEGKFPQPEQWDVPFHISTTAEELDLKGIADNGRFVESLPQSVGNPFASQFAAGTLVGKTNTGLGFGIDLHGLGQASTVVLINGRRLAPSGSSGTFTDVSNIPTSAIEYIDVIPDGGSTLYGADAVGGVVNFVLHDKFEDWDTRVRYGTVTEGGFRRGQASQTGGWNWGSGGMIATFEFAAQGAVPTSARALATSNLTPFGGTNFDDPFASPGNIVGRTNTYAIRINPISGQVALVPGTENQQNRYEGADITPGQRRYGFAANVHQEVAEAVTVYFDSLITSREVDGRSSGYESILAVPYTNPHYVNPDGGTGPVDVAYNFLSALGPEELRGRVDTGNFAVGSNWTFGGIWKLEGYVGYTYELQHNLIAGQADPNQIGAYLADSNPATAFNPFGNGTDINPAILKAIASPSRFILNSNLKLASLKVDGGFAQHAHSGFWVTSGADVRQQTLEASTTPESPAALDTDLHRQVSAAFTELRFQLHDLPKLSRAELRIGARYERYEGYGSGTAPKVELLWAPVAGLSLEAGWAETFDAPNLTDLSEAANGAQFAMLPDNIPKSGQTETLIFFGGNRDLRMQKATSRTFGIRLQPLSLPGFLTRIHYFDVLYRDRVEQTPFEADILVNPAFGLPLVIRDSLDAVRADLCSRSTFAGAPADCLSTPIGAIVDDRLHNISELNSRGFDVSSAYKHESSFGKWGLALDGTYFTRYAQTDTPHGPLVSSLNTPNNPLRLRMNGTATWEWREWNAAITANFSNAYEDPISSPPRHVSSWTTYDLQMSWSGAGDAWWSRRGLTLSVAVQNLFDKKSPFLNDSLGVGFDVVNGSLVGRVVEVGVRKDWGR